ncbi:NusG domain II-containing protein [Treponema brennaborense]|uniref:Uncharacterized protein n=1 Tax=Treponema brennaborense (strain DSM 12168 / CIP 105900 / DD5/3) TaxID=906968 RepID=F4LNK9_TREBD|nr:NusG domain II-containing protein [Treponema brennaborense]AEE15863.1 hypothetical protein Trebr_0419 [Treponema brennaborense DSM 12168]
MNKHRTLHLFDTVCILAAAGICAFSVFAAVNGKSGTPVLIIDSPDGEYVYRLTQDETIEVKGSIGVSRIHICGGQAVFEDSPCANKTCVSSPPVGKNGDWSACLPNMIFIRVEAENDDSGVDITAF